MTEFPKSYNPAEAESNWYDIWEREGYFRPEHNATGEPFTIVIPPPNVTGQLHMGHALNATIQDIMTRWHRMNGHRALWLPGMDHAGIATQNVVERQIDAEGTNRHALGREQFIERVWTWKEEYGGRIINQLRKIGASCDWSRQRFTMDEGLSRAVREVFVKLYEDGLIYRDNRLINWCTRCHTALSDLEVEHEDIEGTLTYIKYPLADNPKRFITVATTRPETMLGDTAVAVNPEDERYREFIGKMLELPLTGRTIPVVADAAVDPAFGTGAVKVTPAHDFNDEAIAKRQSPALPSIIVIGADGLMTEEAGPKYKGLKKHEARKMVVKDLNTLELLVEQRKHQHSVGHCYRCKTTVEPFATPQWFVRIGPLAEPAIKAVQNGDIRFVPKGWENSYFSWMENIQDWCITRQIWWGHRVPVWYCADCGETIVSRTDPTSCTKCGSSSLTQDEDVLDTWFSSALWPFSTLGWPDKTEDLKAHYPTTVLVTGFDIIFFWVARMIMMGLKFMDDVPFRDVYIHALVRDEQGQKMSKSKGNVIDPLIMTERYGADAFRFTLAAFAAQGRDVRFSEARVEGYKHFINKLWNATRFILMQLPEGFKSPTTDELARHAAGAIGGNGSTLGQRWILSRLSDCAADMNRAITDYRFNDAANAAYQFAWHEFCDWYIEMAKTEATDESTAEGTRNTLLHVLENIMRLLHPIMPFITEEIWQRLPIERTGKSVCVAAYPKDLPRDEAAIREMALVMDAVNGIRNIRGEINVSPAKILDVTIKTTDEEATAIVGRDMGYIESLARAKCAEAGPNVQKPENCYTSVKSSMEIYVSLGGVDVEGELNRLGKELKKTDDDMEFITKKLSNENFVKRAPADVVAKEKARHEELAAKRAKIIESMEILKKG